MEKIHKPKHIRSIDGLGIPQNNRTIILATPSIGITTETWKTPKEPWTESGVVIAQHNYKWVTKWETGKNYIITKIFNADGEMVGIYCDVSAPVIKSDEGFEFYDWYLDVWQEIGKEPVILDEDELELALFENFISEKDGETARQTAKFLTEIIKAEDKALSF